MADRPPAPDPAGSPDRYPGTPGWVKVLGVVAVIVVLLIAFILVTGLGGPHGPQRHGASTAVAALRAPADARLRLSPPLRKGALAVHLTVSVGWIGAVAAYTALDLAAATSADPATLRAAYRGMGLIAGSVIVPLALATLVTGLVVSLGTKWGLARHWWVLVSLTLTVFATVVLLVETGTIAAYAAVAADPAATEAELRRLGSTLVHSVGGSLVLLVVLVLNVYKPPGLTPYGWRKQQEAHRARSASAAARTASGTRDR